MLRLKLSVVALKLCAMAGRAVVTMVLSSVSMKNVAATMSGMRRENAGGAVLAGAVVGAGVVKTGSYRVATVARP